MAIREARDSIRNVERINDFASILLAAENDDWGAFKKLMQLAEDDKNPLRDIALNAVVMIRVSYGGPIALGYLNVDWKTGVDPSKLSLTVLKKFLSESAPLLHAHLAHIVWDRSDIPKRERMEFLVQVVSQSNSLNAKCHAARLFVSAAGDKDLKWTPFTLEPILSWWESHKDKIE